MIQHRLALGWLFGPYAALLVLGMQITSFASRGRPWLGEGMLSVETAAVALPIVGGIVCAAAAVDASRIGRSLGYHPIGTARHGVRGYMWAALWAAVPASIAQVLVILFALAIGRVTEISASWPSLAFAIIVQCAALLWFAALGSSLGRHIQPIIAGVAGAAIGYLTIFVSTSIPDQLNPLDFGGATLSRIGLDYNWRSLATQLVIFITSSAIFIVVSPRSKPTSSPTYIARSVGVTLVAIGLFIGLGRVDNMPRVVLHRVAPTSCAGTAPAICTYPEQRRIRPEITRWVERLDRDARRAGYTSLKSDRYEMESAGYAPSPPTRGIAIPDDDLRSSYQGWVAALVTPTHCPQISGFRSPEDSYFADMNRLVTTWTAIGKGQRPKLSNEQVGHIVTRFNRCDIKVSKG